MEMSLTFEWHEAKAEMNLAKHGVGFDEAKTVFNDPRAISIANLDHSVDEQRYIVIGISNRLRVLTVSYTERGDNMRIISARKATTRERNNYEND